MNPIWTEFCQQPLAFVEGFISGILKLDVNQEPIKGWLVQQGISPVEATSDSTPTTGTRQRGPQSISID